MRLNATEPRSVASRRESSLRMSGIRDEAHSCRRPELHSPEAKLPLVGIKPLERSGEESVVVTEKEGTGGGRGR